MKTHPNELFFYYAPESNGSKQTRAMAYAITRHVNEFNFQKERLTSTAWRTLLNLLGLRAKDLLNRAHPEYQAKIAGHDFNDEDWINILINHPYMLKAPIAVKNNHAVLCKSPNDILKLG
ncbi:arsenate reductase family protein [Penaeicola halotolerans]|uniref:arsenate reductase family protein n=1 Tax=Penaeicola halotolerans TaxID=2793196 RepID=UPI001CF88645|nr:ArsC/Spx/MgsR family protein [Penaeicola halotolerans]